MAQWVNLRKDSEPFLPLLFHLSIRYISSQPSTEESSQSNQERKIEKMKDRRGRCGGATFNLTSRFRAVGGV